MSILILNLQLVYLPQIGREINLLNYCHYCIYRLGIAPNILSYSKIVVKLGRKCTYQSKTNTYAVVN